jgi:hypothetical protein
MSVKYTLPDEISKEYLVQYYKPIIKEITIDEEENLGLYVEKIGGSFYPNNKYDEYNDGNCSHCEEAMIPFLQVKDPDVKNSTILWQVRYCNNEECRLTKPMGHRSIQGSYSFPYFKMIKIAMPAKQKSDLQKENAIPKITHFKNTKCYLIEGWTTHKEYRDIYDLADYLRQIYINNDIAFYTKDNPDYYEELYEEILDLMDKKIEYKNESGFKMHGISYDWQNPSSKQSFIQLSYKVHIL